AGVADAEHHFTLVVELGGRARTYQRRVVADEGTRRAQEHARKFRGVLAVFIFRVTVGIVDADADDFFRRGDRRQPGDVVQRVVRRAAPGIFGEHGQRAGGDRFA